MIKPVVLETLEGRQLFFASPTEPYPVTNAILKGQFVSAVPKVAVAGTTLPIWFKIINPSNQPQSGLIDLTFVLDSAKNTLIKARATDLSISTQTPAVGKSSPGPAVTTQADVSLNIKPHGSQVFKFTGTLPDNGEIKTGSYYYFCCSVDSGGAIAAGTGYEATIIGSGVPTYVPLAVEDVNISSFHFSLNPRTNVGVFTGNLTNFGQNANVAATGSVALSLFASVANSFSGQQYDPSQVTALTLTPTSVTLKSLGIGRSMRVTIKIAVPASLPAGTYYLGVNVDRTSALPGSPGISSVLYHFSNTQIAINPVIG